MFINVHHLGLSENRLTPSSIGLWSCSLLRFLFVGLPYLQTNPFVIKQAFNCPNFHRWSWICSRNPPKKMVPIDFPSSGLTNGKLKIIFRQSHLWLPFQSSHRHEHRPCTCNAWKLLLTKSLRKSRGKWTSCSFFFGERYGIRW